PTPSTSHSFPSPPLSRSGVNSGGVRPGGSARGRLRHIERRTALQIHDAAELPPAEKSLAPAARDTSQPDEREFVNIIGPETVARSEEHTSELQSLTNLVC